MTGGGPGFSTTVLVQYIYQMAFTEGQMGYASAIGVVLYLLLLVFTVFQWRVTRQSENV
jgi:multiple sugar transport system permease protein